MEEFTKIGKLTKSHGLHGEIVLRVDEERKQDLFTTKKIYIEHHGYKVPYFIDNIKDAKPIRIKIEDITNPDEAHNLTNHNIYLSQEDLTDLGNDSEDLVYSYMVGSIILLSDETEIGTVKEVLSYPQQEIAVIDYKTKEILIPINESYIVSIDTDNDKIVMELPDGILDL